MKNHRVNHLITISIIILLGLFSRTFTFIPLCIGDVLYATMIYFMIRFLLLKTSKLKIVWIAIAICFAIEFSQLYQSDWIIAVRKTVPGHYILGHGFLFSDLIAYCFGVLTAFILDRSVY
ncbi:DUF2809 domain-containing protein [Flavobacterium sandaracinum]|uniref:DUF2809 domain-containing protein n=1 Tax=Flavobacterium sandaracinum TaxID=2541733 RepID=A0A4V2Z0C1_9FLAO|nr:DUF2809 domain-containing protein [Flavobacterium sandaracinum]TDE00448.1 DUF2809 domain-containing protein [Flavobacterium sandaracinum]